MERWLFSLLLSLTVITGCTNTQPKESLDNLIEQNEKNEQINLNETTDNDVSKQSKEQQSQKESDTISDYPIFDATIVSVSDGDTFTISFDGREEKVRLLLVDTPETVDPRKGVQPYGPEASEFTKSLLKSGTNVEVEKDVSERDKYGRFLAYVYVDGKMINELLLEKGLARVAYVYAPNTRYVDRFNDIQNQARQDKVGIWSIEDYVHSDGYNSDGTKEDNNINNQGSKKNPYQNNPKDDQETNKSCKGKIKGNANSNIYHIPGGSYYESTGDNIVWFCSEQEAQDAGFRKSKR